MPSLVFNKLKFYKANASLVLLAFSLCGCQMYDPQAKSADVENSISGNFKSTKSDSPFNVRKDWWHFLDSKNLDSYVDEALQNSPTLAQTYARLRQVEALSGVAKSALYPTLDAGASAGVGETDAGKNSPQKSFEAYSVSVKAGYELDLWSRINSEIEASQKDIISADLDAQSATSILVSNVVLTWVQIQCQMKIQEVLTEQKRINEITLGALENRFLHGRNGLLEVLQQRQTLNNTLNQIPISEQKLQALLTKFAVLLGRAPNQEFKIELEEIGAIIPLETRGLPTQVLEERPDVKAAKVRLEAEAWRLAAAKTTVLPTFNLSSGVPIFTTSSSRFSDLFEAWTLQIAGSVAQPVFDGGRRFSQMDAQQALCLQRLDAYKSTVLNAVKEVQDSITNEETQAAYLQSLETSLKTSVSALEESRNRFNNSMVDYLNVVSAITTKQNLEISTINARSALIEYRISFYRSLGGSWIESLSAEVNKASQERFENSNNAPIAPKPFEPLKQIF